MGGFGLTQWEAQLRGISCMGGPSDRSFWKLVQGGREMQRDDDYLRELLMKLEAQEDWQYLFIVESDEDEREFYHLILLADAGLLERWGKHGECFRITNAGHDFLAMTRQSEAWAATKAGVRHLGGASVQMLYKVAEGYARQKLAEFGVPIAP